MMKPFVKKVNSSQWLFLLNLRCLTGKRLWDYLARLIDKRKRYSTTREVFKNIFLNKNKRDEGKMENPKRRQSSDFILEWRIIQIFQSVTKNYLDSLENTSSLEFSLRGHTGHRARVEYGLIEALGIHIERAKSLFPTIREKFLSSPTSADFMSILFSAFICK